MREGMATALSICCLLFALDSRAQGRRPSLAGADSPWNVLAYGGKGEMHGAPICNTLAYFSKSPLPLDFDNDLFQLKETDLETRAQVNLIGTIGARRVYEIKQTVTRKGKHPGTQDPEAPPTMKVVLLERQTNEFCDIYQNQYTYDPSHETDEALIIDISGRKVLKTYETDAHTWFLTYWAIDGQEPLRLRTDDLDAAISSESPPGAQSSRAPLNLTGSHFTADIFAISPDQDPLGSVDLQLGVEGDKIIARRKTWVLAVPQVK